MGWWKCGRRRSSASSPLFPALALSRSLSLISLPPPLSLSCNLSPQSLPSTHRSVADVHLVGANADDDASAAASTVATVAEEALIFRACSGVHTPAMFCWPTVRPRRTSTVRSICMKGPFDMQDGEDRRFFFCTHYFCSLCSKVSVGSTTDRYGCSPEAPGFKVPTLPTPSNFRRNSGVSSGSHCRQADKPAAPPPWLRRGPRFC